MKMTIKEAAKIIDIKYENAKAIHRVYKNEQRTDKCRHRYHKVEKELKKKRQRRRIKKLHFMTSFEVPNLTDEISPKSMPTVINEFPYAASPLIVEDQVSERNEIAPFESFA